MATNAATFRRSGAAPAGTSPGRARGFVSARAVGTYVPKLTHKAFEKYGFAAAALITDWAMIVGKDIAGYTAPERLKWPRGVGIGDEIERWRRRPPGGDADRARRPGARARRPVQGASRSSSASTATSAIAPSPSCASCRPRCPSAQQLPRRAPRRRPVPPRSLPASPTSGCARPWPTSSRVSWRAASSAETAPALRRRALSFIHLERQPFCLIPTLGSVLLGRRRPSGR